MSELDSNRQNFLINSIGDIQTIVTCTGLEEFINNRMNINKIFKVTDGHVVNENYITFCFVKQGGIKVADQNGREELWWRPDSGTRRS